MNDFEKYKEARAEALRRMRATSNAFYASAAQAGCHAFIEFCGLMNEYIKLCEEAEAAGIDWLLANTHTGQALPLKSYNVAYLAEKLDCIYGPSIDAAGLRQHFVEAFVGKAPVGG